MTLTFKIENLSERAQEWALEQIAEKHPIQTRDRELSYYTGLYDYNCKGDIVDYSNGSEEYEGLDPEYYEQEDGV